MAESCGLHTTALAQTKQNLYKHWITTDNFSHKTFWFLKLGLSWMLQRPYWSEGRPKCSFVFLKRTLQLLSVMSQRFVKTFTVYKWTVKSSLSIPGIRAFAVRPLMQFLWVLICTSKEKRMPFLTFVDVINQIWKIYCAAIWVSYVLTQIFGYCTFGPEIFGTKKFCTKTFWPEIFRPKWRFGPSNILAKVFLAKFTKKVTVWPKKFEQNFFIGTQFFHKIKEKFFGRNIFYQNVNFIVYTWPKCHFG